MQSCTEFREPGPQDFERRKPSHRLLSLKGASHGMCTVNKDQVNEDLLAFIKG
jgi:hypothetical protein